MKIGILTFQYAYNYGALLQAYGLCKFLEGLGHEVCFINYIPQATTLIQRLKRNILQGRKLFHQGHNTPCYMLKQFQFDRFRQHFLALTPLCHTRSELEEISRDFNAVIVGSDQVWNGRFIRNVASHYFLDFIASDQCRRISYSACFGYPRDKQTVELIEAAPRLLKQFDGISVRNEMSARLVNDLSGRQAEIVLDPTLMYDFRDIWGCKTNSSKFYIAAYGALNNDSNGIELGKNVLNLVREHLQFPVIVVGAKERLLNGDANFISAGPLEWLKFLRESSFICTDSFHATVFAVKFRKPFIAWCNVMPERIRYFLKICGLENRLVDKADPVALDQLINSPIDYDAVSERLEPHINSSRQFLEKSLAR